MDILLMDQESQVRARFAPSPTGHLHVGNARTALFNWLFARRHGGTFILRVEDTDRERSTRRFEDQLVEDLAWLGLNWDEGPDVGGGYGPYRQSDRGEIYHQHSSRLLSEGKAYLCFCTPEELAEERERAIAEHRPQVYSGKCRALDPEESKKRLTAGQRASVRLRIPPHPIAFEDMVRGRVEFPNDVVSDLIIVRSDNMPVYNFVVVIDDALMKITHVIRGDDHLSNTPRQVAVYEALGWPVPKFAHLSTILGSDRERLSKRHGATSVANFRDLGVLPEALDNYLALLGWAPSGGNRETFSLGELQKEFSLERVTPSPAVFDMEKLHWFNRHYIKVADPERIRELAFHFFARAGLMGSTGTPPANVPDRELSLGISYGDLPVPVKTWFVQVLDLFLPSVGQLNQLVERALPVFLYDPLQALTAPANAAVMAGEKTEAVIDALTRLALSHDDGSMTAESFKALVNEVKLLTGAKGKDLFHPIRIVITGSHSGPEFEKLIPIVEQGSKLDLPQHVLSVRQRVQEFAEARHPGKGAS